MSDRAERGKRADVMTHFQEQMERFLEMQKRLVMSHLGREGDRSAAPPVPMDGTWPPPAAPPIPATPPADRSGAGEPAGAIERWVLETVPVPEAEPSAPLASGRVLLMTDDGTGVAAALAGILRKEGLSAAILQAGGGGSTPGGNRYPADLSSPEPIREVLARIRQQQGPIGSLLHLAPLGLPRPFGELTMEDWRALAIRDCLSLFLLAQALGPELEEASGEGAALLGVTGLGGTFAVEQASDFPAQGSVVGLTKTLAREWPGVRVRAVDLDPAESPGSNARRLWAELRAADRHLEVGYRRGRRRVIQEAFRPATAGGAVPDSSWVWLLTGGARGITAEIALELARNSGPTLVLVGTSPLPEQESGSTAGITEPRQMRAALLEELRQRGQPPSPREVEAAYQKLLKSREIRDNLARMRQAGSRVLYHPADVRDPAGFGGLLDRIYREHGRIDGVVHGAGIIEDKLIRDKSPESFQRVFNTKVESAFLLSRHLEPESVRLLVFFTSVAGRLGNRGQGDYAAANQVLGKLARLLDERWPGRVVSIDWGPWDKMGMVSEELRREFARRGWVQIPPPVGSRMFCQEAGCTDPGGEVVIAGRTHQEADARMRVGTLPLLEGRTLEIQDGRLEIDYTLDPRLDRLLDDHRMDGRAVLPVAEAVELMAELAQDGWPHLQVAGLAEVRVQRGIILKDQVQDIRLTAAAHPAPDGAGLDVNILITEPGSSRVPFYRGTILLRDKLPERVRYAEAYTGQLRSYTGTVEQAYRQHLFHGPALQNITRLGDYSREGMTGSVRASSPAEGLAWKPKRGWLIDPVVVDSGFQIAFFWARIVYNVISLPSYFPVYQRYAPLTGGQIECYLHTRADPETHSMLSNLYLVDREGWMLGSFHGVESTLSGVLNRIVEGEKS